MGIGGALGQSTAQSSPQAPSQSTGQTPAPAGKGGIMGQVGNIVSSPYVNSNLGQAATGGMPQRAQVLGSGFGPGVDNFAPPGSTGPGAMPQQALGSAFGALRSLGQSPAMQTLGQVATGQQPVPEWIRLAQQSGNMQNPYASQAPQTLNQASLRPLQAPDTSQDAYNRYMAQTSFTPGGAPTYDQFVQQRNQNFQQAQQFEQMSPQQQLAHMQAMNDQKMQALQAAGMPQSLEGPGAMPPSLGQQILNGQMPQGMPQRGFPPQGMPQRGFPPQGMPQRGFPGARPMPFPQQGGAGDRTPLQATGLAELLRKMRG